MGLETSALKATLLGTGASAGVPLLGCKCAVCSSSSSKNKRTRTSLWVQTQGKSILIDTSPDLRQQALTQAMTHLDAVLYTHPHADHIHGIDELRSFNYMQNKPLKCYGNQETISHLQAHFAYAFLPKPEFWYRPCLVAEILTPYQSVQIGGVEILPFTQWHGEMETLGFRIGDLAYSTDVHDFPEASFDALKDIKLWIVDCLRISRSTHSHAALPQTLKWIQRIKPERAILIHMSHEIDYHQLSQTLPAGVEVGYDGMVLELE